MTQGDFYQATKPLQAQLTLLGYHPEITVNGLSLTKGGSRHACAWKDYLICEVSFNVFLQLCLRLALLTASEVQHLYDTYFSAFIGSSYVTFTEGSRYRAIHVTWTNYPQPSLQYMPLRVQTSEPVFAQI